LYASLFRALKNVVLNELIGPSPKIFWLFLGKVESIFASLMLMFHILGRLFFSGSFNIIVRRSISTSVHRSLFASPDLMAVSFSSWRNIDSFLGLPAIRSSISFSVGINGIFLVIGHLGFSQDSPRNFRNEMYAFIMFLFRLAVYINVKYCFGVYQ
jgi:hypothetical protein